VLGCGDAFRGSRHFPRHRFNPCGLPGPAVGLVPAVTPRHPGGKLRCAATPVLLWRGQSLPAATAPAPGPHTSRGEVDFSSVSADVGLIRIAPGPFQSQVEPSWGRAQAPKLSMAPVRPRGFLDLRMSLSTLLIIAAVAQRRISGMFATPVSFRLTQGPLGADLLPQAPKPVVPSRHREGLSIAQVWWEFRRLSPIPVPSLSSSRNPKL